MLGRAGGLSCCRSVSLETDRPTSETRSTVAGRSGVVDGRGWRADGWQLSQGEKRGMVSHARSKARFFRREGDFRESNLEGEREHLEGTA